MLRGTAQTCLADFQVLPGADGSLPNPYDWRSLNLATDMGPDMVCMVHYLSYEKQVNLNADWDLSHSSSNAAKNALKRCKLWTHQVLVGREWGGGGVAWEAKHRTRPRKRYPGLVVWRTLVYPALFSSRI